MKRSTLQLIGSQSTVAIGMFVFVIGGWSGRSWVNGFTAATFALYTVIAGIFWYRWARRMHQANGKSTIRNK